MNTSPPINWWQRLSARNPDTESRTKLLLKPRFTLYQHVTIMMLAVALPVIAMSLRDLMVDADPGAATLRHLLWYAAALFTGIVLAASTTQVVTAPARVLRAALQRLAAGDLECRVAIAPDARGEFADIARDLNTMAARMERKQGDLLTTEDRWRLALDGAGHGAYDWDFVNKRLFISPGFKAIFGYRDDEVGDGTEAWSRFVHRDDQAMAQEALRAHLRGESALFDMEYRIRSRDGSWRWVHNRGLVVERDSRGHALRMTGTNTDITMRKESQLSGESARLELASNQDLFQAVFGSGPQPMAILGPGGLELREANAAAQALFGIDAITHLGRPLEELDLWEREGERDAVLELLRSGQGLEGYECRMRARDGTIRDILLHARPIEVRGESLLLAQCTDITATKAAQRASERVTRCYAALSEMNLVAERCRDRGTLLAEACRIAADHLGANVAFAALLEPNGRDLRLEASAGPRSRAYVAGLDLGQFDEHQPQQPGALARAMISRYPYFCNDISGDTRLVPWHARCAAARSQSLVAFALIEGGRVVGGMSLHHVQAGAYDSETRMLVEQFAAGIARGLERLDAEKRRRRAEKARAVSARPEMAFSGKLLQVLGRVAQGGRCADPAG